MPVVMDAARMTTRTISDAVYASYKNLSIHFIVHHNDHLTEALGLAAQEILWHPAAEDALHLLKQRHDTKTSNLLGIAYARDGGFLFAKGTRRYLCVCTINLNEQDTQESLKQTAWHQAYHIIKRVDAFEDDIRNDKGRKYRKIQNTDTNQNNRQTGNIIPAPNKALEIIKDNLCADIFSALINGYNGNAQAVTDIARLRTGNILKKKTMANPEFYPFPIAIDSTQATLTMMADKTLSKKRIIPEAIKLAVNLRNMFSEDELNHWISYAGNTQNMIWRNIRRRDILCAAIHMASNTHTRLIAHQIAELQDIEPSAMTDATEFYNNFTPRRMSEKIHNNQCEETFEKALASSLKLKNGTPLRKAAYKHNIALIDGEINGWCAFALQYAAKALELAYERGHSPEDLARHEFEGCRARVKFKSLCLINKLIILEKRKGASITLEKLIALCTAYEELDLIGSSIKETNAPLNAPTESEREKQASIT